MFAQQVHLPEFHDITVCIERIPSFSTAVPTKDEIVDIVEVSMLGIKEEGSVVVEDKHEGSIIVEDKHQGSMIVDDKHEGLVIVEDKVTVLEQMAVAREGADVYGTCELITDVDETEGEVSAVAADLTICVEYIPVEVAGEQVGKIDIPAPVEHMTAQLTEQIHMDDVREHKAVINGDTPTENDIEFTAV